MGAHGAVDTFGFLRVWDPVDGFIRVWDARGWSMCPWMVNVPWMVDVAVIRWVIDARRWVNVYARRWVYARTHGCMPVPLVIWSIFGYLVPFYGYLVPFTVIWALFTVIWALFRPPS